MRLSLLRKARSFARRSLFEQAWLLPAWLMLGASRLLILFIAFRSLAPHLGEPAGVGPWLPLIDKRQEVNARRIARVVQMAAKYTPWESNCFPQAVTARILLGLYGIPYGLFFGVAQEPNADGLSAHAWVATGRVRVAGGESFDRFAVLGCFYG